MVKSSDKKKNKDKTKSKEKAVPQTGPEFMQMILEENRTEILKIVDEETLKKIAPIVQRAAFSAQEFDGRRWVVGYKRAVKCLVLGEDAEKLSKGRD